MGDLTEHLLERLCEHQLFIFVVFVTSCVALLFTLFSLVALEPGSSARTVAFMNIPGLLFMVGWTGYVVYRCESVAALR